MVKSPVLYKSLVVGVIVLFVGVGIQPAIATVKQETEIEIEPKDYLFQTIIDIANNPEVKELLEKYKYDLFKIDIDRKIYRKLFLRNPRLMFNTLFSKPSITIGYLNKCYNQGIEITKILGEDKVLEIIENVEVTDRMLFDELNDIISKDEILSGRFAILEEMNRGLKPDLPFIEDPVICGILTILGTIGLLFFIPVIIFFGLSVLSFSIFKNIQIIGYIFVDLCIISLIIGSLLMAPYPIFCTDDWYPN